MLLNEKIKTRNMLYYKKNNYLVRLNETDKVYLELFDDTQQLRIMEIRNDKLYDDLVTRIQNYGFQTTTESEFNTKLLDLKNKV
jgi:hypothetical protein